MDCNAYGRKEVRPLNALTVYRKALAEGSVRLRICENQAKRARKNGRLRLKAKEVLEEIKAKVKEAIKETSFQKTDRDRVTLPSR